VVGVDIRPENIQRAELVREHLGVGTDRLRFEVADVFNLHRERMGTFDVVLCLGLIYHLENPIGALRIARALTAAVCVVESQLVEPHEPLRHRWGTRDKLMAQEAAWAAYPEPPERQETSPTASHGDVVSLIPNRAALIQAMHASGFERVECPAVPPGLNRQYVEGHRLVAVGWA
jgi:SAM-dependent methyltransferase